MLAKASPQQERVGLTEPIPASTAERKVQKNTGGVPTKEPPDHQRGKLDVRLQIGTLEVREATSDYCQQPRRPQHLHAALTSCRNKGGPQRQAPICISEELQAVVGMNCHW